MRTHAHVRTPAPARWACWAARASCSATSSASPTAPTQTRPRGCTTSCKARARAWDGWAGRGRGLPGPWQKPGLTHPPAPHPLPVPPLRAACRDGAGADAQPRLCPLRLCKVQARAVGRCRRNRVQPAVAAGARAQRRAAARAAAGGRGGRGWNRQHPAPATPCTSCCLLSSPPTHPPYCPPCAPNRSAASSRKRRWSMWPAPSAAAAWRRRSEGGEGRARVRWLVG